MYHVYILYLGTGLNFSCFHTFFIFVPIFQLSKLLSDAVRTTRTINRTRIVLL